MQTSRNIFVLPTQIFFVGILCDINILYIVYYTIINVSVYIYCIIIVCMLYVL